MMQCIKDCMAVNFTSLLLAELWLKLESCELVGLPAMSIKQQATESEENGTSLYLKKHRENWSYKGL